MMDPSIIFPDLWIAHEGGTIHNPRDIIDEEPIYNVPRIMDGNRASIIQGKS
jgi:hypothetical protein